MSIKVKKNEAKVIWIDTAYEFREFQMITSPKFKAAYAKENNI